MTCMTEFIFPSKICFQVKILFFQATHGLFEFFICLCLFSHRSTNHQIDDSPNLSHMRLGRRETLEQAKRVFFRSRLRPAEKILFCQKSEPGMWKVFDSKWNKVICDNLGKFSAFVPVLSWKNSTFKEFDLRQQEQCKQSRSKHWESSNFRKKIQTICWL